MLILINNRIEILMCNYDNDDLIDENDANLVTFYDIS